MSFFIGNNETELDRVSSAETLMKVAPDYYGPRFQAIADLRALDDGSGHTGEEFRLVASLVNVPLLKVAKIMDPEFLKDRRRFYAFLDKHPQYLTYQRRNGGRGTARDDLRMPLSALGLDLPPGVTPTFTEHPVAETTDVPSEGTP